MLGTLAKDGFHCAPAYSCYSLQNLSPGPGGVFDAWSLGQTLDLVSWEAGRKVSSWGGRALNVGAGVEKDAGQ